CLHLLKLCDAWTDLGYGDFHLWFVRDQQKREVDFLITERRKPYALIETKMNWQNPDPSLRYFTERLKPVHSLQIARNTAKGKRPYSHKGILCLPATHFLYWF
ncbi:MAG TPA: hypothetical protein VJ044_09200, partial [Candidatus Hodarchaeales archaeon]|nr:hypothetical protein [Candidatus Hodarchaeales archaeon]